MSNKSPLIYEYHFFFYKNKEVVFELNLDPVTFKYISPAHQEQPKWARLDDSACDQCICQQEGLDFCPVAVNIAGIIKVFGDMISYDVVDITIKSKERLYVKKQISIQHALSSMLGIIMVTSGCKDLDMLKPMVKFHLPFASIEETIYRATSMYLLAQYFRYKRGLVPDWDMDGLISVYRRIDTINMSLCNRLRRASNEDANLNAVVVLDTFAQVMPISVEEGLAEFEDLFIHYLL
ncbi:DUF6901 family protein [Candidatus Neomarinimicrobiota bacterium]